MELERIKAAVAAISGRRRAPTATDVSPGREARLEAELTRLSGLAEARGALEGNARGLATQLESAETRLASLTAKAAEQSKTTAAAAFLGAIRNATHPSAVPRDRAAAYIGRLNSRLGLYCRELRLPFALSVDPEQQDLMFQSDDLRAPTAHRLSEGQRTMCAWAWHLALYSMHGGRIGFMVLDEPTQFLDAENRRCVAAAMRDLSRFCQDAGMQVVVVSHDLDLASAFDVAIRLDGGAA
jgi:DNA repair exonuclease SbcCD ATPase subunit